MALINRQQEPSVPRQTAGAPADAELRRHAFQALGTECLLQFVADNDEQAAGFVHAVTSWVQRFESRYTRFRDDSLVGQINLAAGNGAWCEVDDEMDHMLDMCGTVHLLTQGIVDVTAGPLARLWDYHTPHPRLPGEADVAAARELVGWHRVEREPGRVRLPRAGMSLDFGGWGKEFAVDMAVQTATEHGINHLLADYGHDLRAIGTPPGRPAWHVGLEDPAKPGELWGSIAALDTAVASSGNYQRGFEIEGQRYGHILDPRSGRPTTNGLQQVTVVAPTCLQAGVLATSAFVLGSDEGLEFIQTIPGAEGCMVSTGAKHQTRGFFQYVVQ